MNDFSDFEQIEKAPKSGKGGETYKWAAIGLLILMLVLALFTTKFWREQQNQKQLVTQLQELLDESQSELLDMLDEQAELRGRLAAFENEFGSIEPILLNNKIELAIGELGRDMSIFKHPEVETLYFFTDLSAEEPAIWSYDVRDDQTYRDSGEIDIAAAKKTLLEQTSGNSITFVKMEGNQLLFLQDTESVQNEECYSTWLSENLFSINIAGSSQQKERYQADAALLENEETRVSACLEEQGL